MLSNPPVSVTKKEIKERKGVVFLKVTGRYESGVLVEACEGGSQQAQADLHCVKR